MTSAWDLTFVLVHVFAAFACAKLFKGACWQQKCINFGFAISMLLIALGFALKLHNLDGYIYFIWLGLGNLELAVLFHIFRLVHKEYLCLPTGLKRFLK